LIGILEEKSQGGVGIGEPTPPFAMGHKLELVCQKSRAHAKLLARATKPSVLEINRARTKIFFAGTL